MAYFTLDDVDWDEGAGYTVGDMDIDRAPEFPPGSFAEPEIPQLQEPGAPQLGHSTNSNTSSTPFSYVEEIPQVAASTASHFTESMPTQHTFGEDSDARQRREDQEDEESMVAALRRLKLSQRTGCNENGNGRYVVKGDRGANYDGTKPASTQGTAREVPVPDDGAFNQPALSQLSTWTIDHLREALREASGSKSEIVLRLHRHLSGYAQVKKGCSIATTAPVVPGKAQPTKLSGRVKCGDCGSYGHEGGSEQCERYTDVAGARQGATGAGSRPDGRDTAARPKTSAVIPATPARVNSSPTGMDAPEGGQMPERTGNSCCPKWRAGGVLMLLLFVLMDTVSAMNMHSPAGRVAFCKHLPDDKQCYKVDEMKRFPFAGSGATLEPCPVWIRPLSLDGRDGEVHSTEESIDATPLLPSISVLEVCDAAVHVNDMMMDWRAMNIQLKLIRTGSRHLAIDVSRFSGGEAEFDREEFGIKSQRGDVFI